MAGARNRVSSGNYITAKPMGVVDGVDMQLTGEVRRIDTEAIQQRLDDGDIVLISPLGLLADRRDLQPHRRGSRDAGAQCGCMRTKLIFLMDTDGVRNGRRQLLSDLSTTDAEALLARPERLPPDVRVYLPAAIRACDNGVKRAHLLQPPPRRRAAARAFHARRRRHDDRRRLRSRTCATRRSTTSAASSSIIEPLEEQGVLVRRSRERLESEIERFVVAEYDNHIIGCAALYAFPERARRRARGARRRIPISAAKATARR